MSWSTSPHQYCLPDPGRPTSAHRRPLSKYRDRSPKLLKTPPQLPTGSTPTAPCRQLPGKPSVKTLKSREFEMPGKCQMASALASLQQGPAPVDCPACGVGEMTSTQSVKQHLVSSAYFSAILCCCCLSLGCVPSLASWFKDGEHKCGKCGALLAVWHRSGRTEVMAHGRS
ncbi:unnamed protein product [Diplocarpon coronariae]